MGTGRFTFNFVLQTNRKIMTETEYLAYCKSQITGPLKEEDLITMLTAWGTINYSLGYKTALADHRIDTASATGSDASDTK